MLKTNFLMDFLKFSKKKNPDENRDFNSILVSNFTFQHIKQLVPFSVRRRNKKNSYNKLQNLFSLLFYVLLK